MTPLGDSQIKRSLIVVEKKELVLSHVGRKSCARKEGKLMEEETGREQKQEQEQMEGRETDRRENGSGVISW